MPSLGDAAGYTSITASFKNPGYQARAIQSCLCPNLVKNRERLMGHTRNSVSCNFERRVPAKLRSSEIPLSQSAKRHFLRLGEWPAGAVIPQCVRQGNGPSQRRVNSKEDALLLRALANRIHEAKKLVSRVLDNSERT